MLCGRDKGSDDSERKVERSGGDVIWETVLAQTREAFGVLRQALQVIDGSNITEHLHGAVRILASIMQVQRSRFIRSIHASVARCTELSRDFII